LCWWTKEKNWSNCDWNPISNYQHIVFSKIT